MKEEPGQDPYELLSPDELKQEALRLLSEFPQESIFEHHNPDEVFEILTRRHGSEYREVLAQRFQRLLQRARITGSFRQHLVGEFNTRYASGGEGSVLEWQVLGEDGTSGIFDPVFARKTEFINLIAWKELMMSVHGMNLEYEQTHPGFQSSANTKIITKMTTWREEFATLHGEQL